MREKSPGCTFEGGAARGLRDVLILLRGWDPTVLLYYRI